MTHSTKTRIVEAALGLFVRKGVIQTTTKDIAHAVGIAEGTIYRHFQSKDELVEHLFVANYVPLAKRLDGIQRHSATTMRKLESIVRYLYKTFDEDPTLFTFMPITQHDAVDKVPPGTTTPVAVVRKVIKEGMKQGSVRAMDVQTATHLAVGLILQLASAHIHGELSGPLSQRANEVIAALDRLLST